MPTGRTIPDASDRGGDGDNSFAGGVPFFFLSGLGETFFPPVFFPANKTPLCTRYVRISAQETACHLWSMHAATQASRGHACDKVLKQGRSKQGDRGVLLLVRCGQ